MIQDTVRKAYLAFIKKDDKDYNSPNREEYGTPFTICTNCANWVNENYFNDEGYIMGYQIEDNPTSYVARNCVGHDFLVVKYKKEWFLIDFWNRWVVKEKTPILINIDRQKRLIKKYYGDINKWTTLDGIKFEHLNLY